MLNQLITIGRITGDVKLEKDGDMSYADLVIATQRSYKNDEGVYETDFIPVRLTGGVAENVAEYCRKGDLVGIKGKIQSEKANEDYKLYIVAEKVTFLSSSRKDGEE